MVRDPPNGKAAEIVLMISMTPAGGTVLTWRGGANFSNNPATHGHLAGNRG